MSEAALIHFYGFTREDYRRLTVAEHRAFWDYMKEYEKSKDTTYE